MDSDIYSLIANYGAVGLLFAFFIYQYFKERSKADTLKSNDRSKKSAVDDVARNLNNEQQNDISIMRTLLDSHIKSNEEAFSVIHNGMNTLGNAMKENNDKLNKNTTAIEVLTAIINERIPCKK